jgi:hypothetical protein
VLNFHHLKFRGFARDSCGILKKSRWLLRLDGENYTIWLFKKNLINGGFNGTIICFYGPFSVAILNNQMVINHVFIWMCALSHKPCHYSGTDPPGCFVSGGNLI